MAITVWPADAVGGEPEYNGRELRQAMTPLMFGATAARPLGARSGVRMGTPSTTVELDGFDWTIKPHSGILDLEPAAEASAYWYAVAADETGTIAAAHATFARVDILTVKLDDPSESDGSTNPGVTVEYTVGTASGSPVAPATPARSMVLATISVPASGGGSPAASWVAPKCAPAGSIIPVPNDDARNALAASVFVDADNPLYVHNKSQPAGRELQYSINGSAWRSLASIGKYATKADAQNIANASATVVLGWVSAPGDPGQIGMSGSGTFVIPASGTYLISGSIAYSSNSTGRREFGFRINGAQRGSALTPNGGTNLVQCVIAPAPVALSAGDLVEFYTFQNSGGTLATLGSTYFNTASIVRL